MAALLLRSWNIRDWLISISIFHFTHHCYTPVTPASLKQGEREKTRSVRLRCEWSGITQSSAQSSERSWELVPVWQGLPPLKYATNVGLNLLNINPLGCQLECRIFCHNYHTYHGLKGSPGQILSRPPCTLLNVQIKLFIDKTEELPQGVIKITTTHQPAKHRHIIRASHPVLIVDLRDFLWQDISIIKVGQNIWYLTAARRWARLFVQENIHWLET